MTRRPQTTSATIELETGTDAPTGALTDGAGHARRFSGWIELAARSHVPYALRKAGRIELAAAIEDWRTSTARAETSPFASEAPD